MGMTQIRNFNKDTREQFWMLRRFLHERQVPRTLATRILRFLEHTCYTQRDSVQESQLKLLPLLSTQLRNELQFITFMKHLMHYPLLNTIKDVSDISLYRLASALHTISIAKDDSVF